MNFTELPIIYNVLLAEFDIDTGSCLRARYPSSFSVPVNSTPELLNVEGNKLSFVNNEEFTLNQQTIMELDDNYCASHMLPDGGEKQVVCRTIFIVNRLKPVISENFSVYSFILENSTSSRGMDTTSLTSNEQLKWIRNSSKENFYINEEINKNKSTGEVTISSKGIVILGPIILSTLQVSSSIPMSVIDFIHELQNNISINHNLDTIRSTFYSSASFEKKDDSLINAMNMQDSNYIQNYSFAVYRTTSTCYGFLLPSIHIKKLLSPIETSSPEDNNNNNKEGFTNIKNNISSSFPSFYGLCAVVTRRDAAAPRGGISKSVAILGPNIIWLEPFFPILIETALQCCDIKGKTELALEQQTNILKRCFNAVAGAQIELKKSLKDVNNLIEMEVMKISTKSSKLTYISYNTSPFGTLHSLKLPLSSELYDFTFSRYGLEQLVEISNSSFWIIVLFIVLEKRFVILSRQGSPNDVCEAALSLGIIGNILDPNFISKKVFPYTSVNGFQHFSNVPGYIVGTLNPIFETQQAWWDILIDLDNKNIIMSHEGNKKILNWELLENILNNNYSNNYNNNNNNNNNSSSRFFSASNYDIQFSKDIINKIIRMKAMGESLNERNRAIRLMIEEYLYLMIILNDIYKKGNNYNNIPRSIQKNFFTPIMSKICSKAKSGSMLNNMPERIFLPGEDSLLLISVATLRRASNCEENELINILNYIMSFVKSSKGVLILLRRMPIALEGLNPLAIQLLHISHVIRQITLEILNHLEAFPLGRAAIAAMNNFLCMVYEEASKNLEVS